MPRRHPRPDLPVDFDEVVVAAGEAVTLTMTPDG
jgi:hypothetical protein